MKLTSCVKEKEEKQQPVDAAELIHTHTPCSLPVGCLSYLLISGWEAASWRRAWPGVLCWCSCASPPRCQAVSSWRSGSWLSTSWGRCPGLPRISLHKHSLISFIHPAMKICFFDLHVSVLSLVLSLLTCVDGPLLEQASVLVHLPAVASCVLPWDGEHRLILLNIKETMRWREDVQRVQTWVTRWSASLWASELFGQCVRLILHCSSVVVNTHQMSFCQFFFFKTTK